MTALLVIGIVALGTDQLVNRSFGVPQPFAVIDDLDIRESSGLAVSHRQRGVFYTHNDSGDGPRFFRFGKSGKVDGKFTLLGIEAMDWEGMASAKLDGVPYLYLGDIGDNGKKRKSIWVYRAVEPVGPGGDIRAFDRYELTYPDGAHNAEALLVAPLTGNLTIVTKSSEITQVFTLDAPKGSGSYRLQLLGTLELGNSIPGSKLVTGGDYSPDGRFIALRTCWSGYEFKVPKFSAKWTAGKLVQFELASEQQGEAICYAIDGKSIITSSEGSPCRLSWLSVR